MALGHGEERQQSGQGGEWRDTLDRDGIRESIPVVRGSGQVGGGRGRGHARRRVGHATASPPGRSKKTAVPLGAGP